ncbi:MAG: hypothetical protein Q9227_001100 [Pyrenula ochraceoflavens]
MSGETQRINKQIECMIPPLAAIRWAQVPSTQYSKSLPFARAIEANAKSRFSNSPCVRLRAVRFILSNAKRQSTGPTVSKTYPLPFLRWLSELIRTNCLTTQSQVSEIRPCRDSDGMLSIIVNAGRTTSVIEFIDFAFVTAKEGKDLVREIITKKDFCVDHIEVGMLLGVDGFENLWKRINESLKITELSKKLPTAFVPVTVVEHNGRSPEPAQLDNYPFQLQLPSAAETSSDTSSSQRSTYLLDRSTTYGTHFTMDG